MRCILKVWIKLDSRIIIKILKRDTKLSINICMNLV